MLVVIGGTSSVGSARSMEAVTPILFVKFVVSLLPYRLIMPGFGGLLCKARSTQGSKLTVDHRSAPHAGAGTGSASAVMASVAVSVPTWLALGDIV